VVILELVEMLAAPAPVVRPAAAQAQTLVEPVVEPLVEPVVEPVEQAEQVTAPVVRPQGLAQVVVAQAETLAVEQAVQALAPVATEWLPFQLCALPHCSKMES
jgi:hypothetical protein